MMVLLIFALLGVITFLALIWRCVFVYLGVKIAWFSVLIVSICISLIIWTWLCQPSEQELTHFKEQRKGVGY